MWRYSGNFAINKSCTSYEIIPYYLVCSLGISLPEDYGINRLETPAVFENTNNESIADVCQIQQGNVSGDLCSIDNYPW